MVTRGDAVTVIATAAELAAFIAPIDTVTEAIQMRGGPLGGTSVCPRVRSDPDGYSFLDDGSRPRERPRPDHFARRKTAVGVIQYTNFASVRMRVAPSWPEASKVPPAQPVRSHFRILPVVAFDQ